MPPEFDAAWEYYTPDPEIEELLEEAANPNGLDKIAKVLGMRDDGITRDPTFGVRLGYGNPDWERTWVKGEKIQPVPKRKGRGGRAPALLITKRCPTCKQEFLVRPARDRTFCCRACIRNDPEKQQLPEVRAKISAWAKARHATNPEWSKQAQANASAGASAQQRRGLTPAQREARQRTIKIAQAARLARKRKGA